MIVLVLVFGFVLLGIYFGYNYVLSQDRRFRTLAAEIEAGKYAELTSETPGVITFVVETGDSTSDIAEKLHDEKLIDNTFVFSILSKVNGYDGAYVAGTHYLMMGYSYDELMYFLTQEPASVTVTIPEGSTYEEIKDLLRKKGVIFDEEELDECMNSPNLFVDYDFVSQIQINDDRDYILSGYLFPDTYTFDINASAESIIRKFLNNMQNKLYDEYYDRAKKINMSMDEVINLASIIQSETSKVSDMMYVSAVFHNRLKTKSEDLQYLGSSATINYLRKKKGGKASLKHTEEEIGDKSPYNTYTHKGLPPGPICMPGADAIAAALYPEPNCNYMYFCATGDGGTVFAVTLKQHNKNVAKYEPNWDKGEDVTEPEYAEDDETLPTGEGDEDTGLAETTETTTGD